MRSIGHDRMIKKRTLALKNMHMSNWRMMDALHGDPLVQDLGLATALVRWFKETCGHRVQILFSFYPDKMLAHIFIRLMLVDCQINDRELSISRSKDLIMRKHYAGLHRILVFLYIGLSFFIRKLTSLFYVRADLEYFLGALFFLTCMLTPLYKRR